MSKLTQKREELGQKHQLMGRVLQEAGDEHDFTKVKAFGEDLDTAAKVEKFRELNQEMADLAADCRRLELEEAGKAYQDVKTEMDRPAAAPPQPGGPGETKTVGQRVIESDEYKAYREDGKGFVVHFDDVEVKTLMETAAGWAPESSRTGRVIEAATRPVQVLDLVPPGDTESASVVYMEETLRTHSAAEKSEGAAYAESAFELTERSVRVRKITDSIPVTDEQLEDEAQVRSYLDQRLRFGLRQRLDNQVLNGNGTPPNIEGILNVSGLQTQAKGTDPRFDAIHKAITKVRVTGRAFPNAIVLHPNDWEAIRLTRTADGMYILGNPSEAGPMTLFGLPVAQGDVQTENTGLVGDFANFCQLYERRGVSVQVGYVGDQFKEGKQTMRADIRVAFVVYRPAAFCTVTGL
jgi:HK97 family phage major capsid protein